MNRTLVLTTVLTTAATLLANGGLYFVGRLQGALDERITSAERTHEELRGCHCPFDGGVRIYPSKWGVLDIHIEDGGVPILITKEMAELENADEDGGR